MILNGFFRHCFFFNKISCCRVSFLNPTDELIMIEIFRMIYMGCIVIVWLAMGFYMFRIVALRKPQVDMWRDTLWNPFNLILMSSKLTQDGLRARKKLFALALTFILMTVIPLVFGISI